jgi:hypothetical protein
MGEDPKAVSAADKAAVAVGQEITRLVVGLVLEGQRALVIAGAARLDLALENVLKHSMRHHPGGSDNLFDPDRAWQLRSQDRIVSSAGIGLR